MNNDSLQPPRPRSPIERMVDAACGFDSANPPPAPKSFDADAVGDAMLEICDAAKAWKKHHAKGTKRLNTAVKRYVELGG